MKTAKNGSDKNNLFFQLHILNWMRQIWNKVTILKMSTTAHIKYVIILFWFIGCIFDYNFSSKSKRDFSFWPRFLLLVIEKWNLPEAKTWLIEKKMRHHGTLLPIIFKFISHFYCYTTALLLFSEEHTLHHRPARQDRRQLYQPYYRDSVMRFLTILVSSSISQSHSHQRYSELFGNFQKVLNSKSTPGSTYIRT